MKGPPHNLIEQRRASLQAGQDSRVSKKNVSPAMQRSQSENAQLQFVSPSSSAAALSSSTPSSTPAALLRSSSSAAPSFHIDLEQRSRRAASVANAAFQGTKAAASISIPSSSNTTVGGALSTTAAATTTTGEGAEALALDNNSKKEEGSSKKKKLGGFLKKKSSKSASASGSKKKKREELVISSPTNFEQRSHVDSNFEWSGEDPNSAFTLHNKLGEGAYGIVYRAEYKNTGFILAAKVLPQRDEKEFQNMKKEINILKKCGHECIVQYYGCATTDDAVWILMDYCGLGAIRDLIKYRQKSSSSALSEPEIAVILLNVIQGLKYLHSQGVIHRDLKSANILLNEEGVAKIADFGVSAQTGHDQTKARTIIGTPLFMAPEVLDGAEYNFKADIWSLGITAIEFAEGAPPYFKEQFLRAMIRLTTEPPPTLQEKAKWSDKFHDFIATCLRKEPEARPTCDQLLQHPFIEYAKSLQASEALKALIEDCRKLAEERLSVPHVEKLLDSGTCKTSSRSQSSNENSLEEPQQQRSASSSGSSSLQSSGSHKSGRESGSGSRSGSGVEGRSLADMFLDDTMEFEARAENKFLSTEVLPSSPSTPSSSSSPSSSETNTSNNKSIKTTAITNNNNSKDDAAMMSPVKRMLEERKRSQTNSLLSQSTGNIRTNTNSNNNNTNSGGGGVSLVDLAKGSVLEVRKETSQRLETELPVFNKMSVEELTKEMQVLKTQLSNEVEKNNRAEETIKELRTQLNKQQKLDVSLLQSLLREVELWKEKTSRLESSLQALLKHAAD
ncbi:Serine/threonine-protein kinase svkA [Balamuthia mandrillaris]